MTVDVQTDRLHIGQIPAWESESRFVGLIAGTGGGKTWFGPRWLAREISRHPGETWMVISPTYKMLARTTLPEWQTFVSGTELQGTYNMGRGEYMLPDGGKIYFLSADNPRGVEGGQIKGAWLDEAGQMPEFIWTAIQARCGLKQGRVLFTTTPYELNWLYDDVFKQWEKGDPDYFVIQFSSDTNPYYPKKEVERARATMDPRLFEMRYGGSFVELSGVVYAGYRACIVPDDSVRISESWRHCAGLDFGFDHPFAIVYGALDPQDILWVYHCYSERLKPIQYHANRMRAYVTYFADATNPAGRADLVGYGYTVLAADNSAKGIFNGIDSVIERIRSNRIRFLKNGCQVLLDRLAHYTFAPNGMPKKVSDDEADGLRYLCQGLKVTAGWRQ